MKPWLIGEHNPYQKEDDAQAHERYALYPYPPQSSGARLATILGLTHREYRERFVRRNLLVQSKWSVRQARFAALGVVAASEGAPLVLLGARVAAAFGFAFEPFTILNPLGRDALVHGGGFRFAIIPHPSGLSRFWNEPHSYARARTTVLSLG